MIEEYKSAICNKKEKGLCCPRPMDIVKSSYKTCPSDSRCTSADSSSFWNEKRGRLHRLSRWTMDYKKSQTGNSLSNLQQEEKGFMLPKSSENANSKIQTKKDNNEESSNISTNSRRLWL